MLWIHDQVSPCWHFRFRLLIICLWRRFLKSRLKNFTNDDKDYKEMNVPLSLFFFSALGIKQTATLASVLLSFSTAGCYFALRNYWAFAVLTSAVSFFSAIIQATIIGENFFLNSLVWFLMICFFLWHYSCSNRLLHLIEYHGAFDIWVQYAV